MRRVLRLEEACWHSDSREEPSANAGVKKTLKGVKNNDINDNKP